MNQALVKINVTGGIGEPRTVTDVAKAKARELGLLLGQRKKLDSFEEKDEVWAIFDEDDGQHTKLAEALDVCRAAGVNVGLSVPCFEHWLILHLTDFGKAVDRHEMQREFERLCPTYKRSDGKKPDCSALIEHIAEAEERAARQWRAHEVTGTRYGRPSTLLYLLTRNIRGVQ